MGKRLTLFIALAVVIAACTATTTDTTSTTADEPTTSTSQAPATTTSTPAPLLDRIGIRTVDGAAEFYDMGTDELFYPRGVNYVDFYEHPEFDFFFSDSVMATNEYDPDRVRTAFNELGELGYNTVRIFFDTCSSLPHCIGNPDGPGLNPAYLDNMTDLMRIAGETGIRLILTANSLPDAGEYWERYFDPAFEENSRGFESRENADWLHAGGIAAKEAFWEDLMSGLAERNAPFEVMLGWELTNEWWLFKHFAPMNLDEGLVDAGNGETYDMAEAGAKEKMIVETTLHYMERMIAVIDQYDPDGLVTMGFIAPIVEGPDWYALTEPFLDTAPLDFFDFHPYWDNPITLQQFAESYGTIGYEQKPVLLGEVGAGKAFIASPLLAAYRGLQWHTEACEMGFDGWLHWGYYPWPDEVLGQPWTFLDSNRLLMEVMAPVNNPDPCVLPEETPKPETADSVARASAELPDQPASNVLDGTLAAWNAGDFPPQWVEVEFTDPATMGSLHLSPEQWPPSNNRYRVIATLDDGTSVLVGDYSRFIASDAAYAHEYVNPLTDIKTVRVETLEAASWVAWREVSVDPPLTEPDTWGTACLLPAGPLHLEPDASSPTAGEAPTDSVLAEGRLVGAGGWFLVSGDLWIEADPTLCPDLAPVEGDQLDLVSVTFDVVVPEGSDIVFITGVFGDSIPPFHDVGLPMNPVGDDTWTLDVMLPRGQEIAYVYTRGGFPSLERPEDCGNTDPREAVVEEGLITDDVVIKWQDTDCS